MNKFRNRQLLKTEGFGEADVLSEIEPIEESVAAQIGIVDQDDQETMGLLSEGEILSEDTETLEQLEGQVESIEESGEELTPEHAETLELVTESIANRWGINSDKRRMAFEGFTGRRGSTRLVREGITDAIGGAWKTFIEWIQDMLDKMADTYRKYLGVGQALISTQKKNAEKISKLGKRNDEKVKAGYLKHFTLDGAVDVEACVKMATSLPTDAKKVFDWAHEYSADASKAIILAQDKDGGKFNNVMKSGVKAPVFGKRLGRKLAPVGPKNSDEQQEVYALPGAAYLQAFTYNLVGGEGDGIYTNVSGMRLIDGGTISKAEDKEKEVPTLDLQTLRTYNDDLKLIGDQLYKVETNHKGARSEARKLLEEAKRIEKEAKAQEDPMAKVRLQQARKVAREAVFSSRHSLNAVLHVYKQVGHGIVKLVSTHMGAYAKA